MYVLSSMPANRQSIAGSLFQTLTRLCTAIGYGIATAIFNTVESSPATSGYYAHNSVEPYAAVFWFSAATAALGVLFTPWLKIGTQGHVGDKGRLVENKNSLEDVDESLATAETSGGGEKEVVRPKDVESGV
jgi:hypothetical protein